MDDYEGFSGDASAAGCHMRDTRKAARRTVKVGKSVRQQFGGARGYRDYHRRNVRNLLMAARRARFACAFSPAYAEILSAIDNCEKAAKLTSRKNWGR